MGKKIGLLVALVGSVVTGGSGWYIVRGPFFGFPMPPVEYILAASGVFILGVVLATWGAAHATASFETDEARVDLEKKQQRTYK